MASSAIVFIHRTPQIVGKVAAASARGEKDMEEERLGKEAGVSAYGCARYSADDTRDEVGADVTGRLVLRQRGPQRVIRAGCR